MNILFLKSLWISHSICIVELILLQVSQVWRVGFSGGIPHCPTNFEKDLASLLTFLFLLQLLNTSFCTQTLSFFKFLHASFALEKFLIFAWNFFSLLKIHFYHFCAIIACCFVQVSDLTGGGNAQVQPLASTNNTQEGLLLVPHKKQFKNHSFSLIS